MGGGKRKKKKKNNHSIATQNELYRSSPQRESLVFFQLQNPRKQPAGLLKFSPALQRTEARLAKRCGRRRSRPLPVPAPGAGGSPQPACRTRGAPQTLPRAEHPPEHPPRLRVRRALLKNNPAPCLPYPARLRGSSCRAIHLASFK